MIKIQIENEKDMSVYKFNKLAEAFYNMNSQFPTLLSFDKAIRVTGDLDNLSPLAKDLYRQSIKGKAVDNLRLIKGLNA